MCACNSKVLKQTKDARGLFCTSFLPSQISSIVALHYLCFLQPPIYVSCKVKIVNARRYKEPFLSFESKPNIAQRLLWSCAPDFNPWHGTAYLHDGDKYKFFWLWLWPQCGFLNVFFHLLTNWERLEGGVKIILVKNIESFWWFLPRWWLYESRLGQYPLMSP